LAYGGLPDPNGTRLFNQGIAPALGGTIRSLDTDQIRESVASAHFKASRPLHPFEGETVPDLARTDAYSWAKSPRLSGRPCEVGPLARAIVSGRYDGLFGLGVWARHHARRNESSLVSKTALEWVASLKAGAPALTAFPEIPATAWGYGLSEAPRGSVGHWIQLEARKVLRYMIIAPTTWNASPRDEAGLAGPIEKALEGVSIADPDDPIEAVRVVHSFDPCLQCAVH
jgi:Ni,Fe-hydrogenase I large subunit